MRGIVIKIIVLLIMLVTSACSLGLHETEGRYLVDHINSERNRNKDSENYYYADKYNIYSYSFKDGKVTECMHLEREDGYFIEDFAVYDEYLYYVKRNDTKYELYRMKQYTKEEELLLSANDMILFNGGKEFRYDDYFHIDVYKDYLFFAIVGKYEYICPIEGDILTESIKLHDLFEQDDWSGNIQQAVYDGIIVERYASSENAYEVSSIRDEQGYKILYSNMDNSIWVDETLVRFSKDADTEQAQYSLDETGLWNIVSIFKDDRYENSEIYDDYLTVENGKIIGLLSVSKHWAIYDELEQNMLDKDVLFELDIETGKSRKLYDTRNNLTKIIGYQNGIVYLVKNEKVYAHILETKEETELFELPKGLNYIIDWQADYLIVREEFCYGQDGDIVMVYPL